MAKVQSTFPTTIDTTLQTDRVSGDSVTSDSYDIIEDAIFELETKVGINSSAVTGSIDYKLERHHTQHEDGGNGEISVTGLSGLLANDQHVLDSEVLTALPFIDSRSYATLELANTAAYNAGKLLVIGQNYTLTANTTLTAAVMVIKGGGFIKASTYTLTINGPFEAGLYQVFIGFSPGDVTFGAAREVCIKWWGAAGQPTDDYIAIQCAISAFPNGNGGIEIEPIDYRTSEKIVIIKSGIRIFTRSRSRRLGGWGGDRAVIKSTSTSKTVLEIKPVSGYLEDVEIDGIYFSRTVMGVEGSKTINVADTLFTRLINCGGSKSQFGLYGENASLFLQGEYNATIGGDITGKDLFGIKIEDCGGFHADKITFDGGQSPTAATTCVYYDNYDVGGGSAGDVRIGDVECSGTLDYVITIARGGGFACDVQINKITADAVRIYALNLASSGGGYAQQANIGTIWVNLCNTTGNANGVRIYKWWNVNIQSVTIGNSDAVGATNDGLSITESKGGTVCGLNLIAIAANRLFTHGLELLRTAGWTFTNITSEFGNPVHLGSSGGVGCSDNVFAAISMPLSPLTIDAGSENNRLTPGCKFGSITDNGTGNAEYLSSWVDFTAFPATTVWGDLTSLTLYPGEWDIGIIVDERGSTPTNIEFGISTTSGNSSAGLTYGDNRIEILSATNSTDNSGSIPSYRVSITSNTIYYLKYSASYTSGTPIATGKIFARRLR